MHHLTASLPWVHHAGLSLSGPPAIAEFVLQLVSRTRERIPGSATSDRDEIAGVFGCREAKDLLNTRIIERTDRDST